MDKDSVRLHKRSTFCLKTMFFTPGAGANNDPQFFTYGNPRNSFTADAMLSGRIDYIFYMSRPGVSIRASR